MLQHAFLTPKPAHLSTSSAGQATYADLFLLAVRAVERAARVSPESPTDLAFELRGFETFLAASARHLHQVLPLAPPASPARHILRNLQRRQPIPVQVGAWAEAARAVAFMSELLATHHTGTGPITPEMKELYRTRRQDLALGRIYALLLSGCLGGRDLTRQAASLRNQSPDAKGDVTLLMQGRINDLDRVIDTVINYTQAGLWQIEHVADARSQLDALPSATPHVAAVAEPRTFTDALSAVQTLRRISFRQAIGLEPASPGSLNDLAQIASLATDPNAKWIQVRNHQCVTGLERVQLAHFRDQLASAHLAWTAAPLGLTTNIQGLTKAPASLAAAFHEIGEHLDDPQVAAALVLLLPQLGKDASATLGQLGSERSLVSAGREPGALSIAWRPITPGQTRRLAASYTAAGRASAAPASTYCDLQSRVSDQLSTVRTPTAEVLRKDRSLPGQQRTP